MISPTACGAFFRTRTTPQPSQNLVEPWWNPGGILVEPWWNPGGTLVEPWWNPGGTLVEPWWNPRGTLVEPSWNLTSGPPRTTPEPVWAETPKLSAVGEKKETVLRGSRRLAWKYCLIRSGNQGMTPAKWKNGCILKTPVDSQEPAKDMALCKGH